MAFFLNGAASQDFEWIKKLPHCFNEDMTFRFVAETPNESSVVVRELLEILSTRAGTRQNTAVSPSYVLFFIDPGITEDIAMRNFINADFKSCGFATVFAFGEMSDIPIGVKALIQTYSDKSSYYLDNENEGFSDFTRDNVIPADIEKFSEEIALFRMSAAGAGIPGTVSFLDMFSAGNVEELDVARRWRMSNPAKSLAAPIGIKSGGEPFMLDIHEKYHGSHGLMAGTTGSGKSECIQAIILSLAVTFHPDDLCFVLIDFKGGGMANLFDGIPHLAGTITNLGNFIKRSMISLEAEMLKRQNMLKDAGVNHIDKYQKLYKEGTVSEPMPHMVLISDEFAELKQQQPEFMAELISVARIGRSLGVHLILATQKPTGVVDDQIWSNTRFRICLKVADKGDSNGMIGVPDAAAITKAGRGYVQVGYNEVFEQIQSAYTGAEYRPTEKYINTETMQVEQIDGAGSQLKVAAMKAKTLEIPGADPKNLPNQLEAVVGYIAKVSDGLGLAPRPIWKEPLPLILSLDKLNREKNPSERYVLAGLIDDPYTQNVWDMKISLDDGHIAVYGTPGCGKTVFLQTIIFDLAKTYPPSDINFELIDFGGGSLDIFKAAPHTKHVITAQESDLITDVLQMVTEEIEVRKSKFAAVRQESLAKYIKESKEYLPTIIVAVDNWVKFAEESPDGAQIIYSILKEGAKYGIIVALTLGGTNSISYKYTDYFSERFALQMSDAIEYAGVVGNTRGVFPMDTKGRGLIRYEGKVLEYQTGVAFGEPDDAARSRQIQGFLADKYGADKYGAVKEAATVPKVSASPAKPAAKPTMSMPTLPIAGGGAKKKKVPLTAFSPENEQGVAVASSRLSGAVYRVPYGMNMCIISADMPDPTVTAAIAASETRTVVYCGIVTSGENKGYVTEADLHEMVSLIKGEEVIIIENFMSFYRAISDADLDKLVAMMDDTAKNLTVIAAIKASDGSALKDQPMGVLVMKKDARGMLVSGKAMDCASVMPGEAVMAMSLDERNFVTSPRTALIYEADGAFEKIVPIGV
jgi:S-DNA-T family DNA segregation ATPase FtsK/SpoIIIE